MVKRVWTNEEKQDIVKSFQEGTTEGYLMVMVL
ncbi:endonuclease [Staphylococcus phage qdsa001]|nr:endonuclease [Staphylococcus phage qdsa001]UVD42339.1 hypothetical protein [Staphylococcus phage vB_SauM-V1SA19]